MPIKTKCDMWVEVNECWDVHSAENIFHAEGNRFYA